MSAFTTKYYIVLLTLFFVVSSCDQGFEDLNTNPLSPTEAQDGALFNSIIESLRLGWERQLFLHNEVLYDVTELAVITAETFGNTEAGVDDVWSNYYEALNLTRELERRFFALEDIQTSDKAYAWLKIIMAYKTFQITDMFGDIPYSEAGRAYDTEAILRPKYDDHETIYRSLIEDLLWAKEIIETAGSDTDAGNQYISFGNFDNLFNGDNSRWLKFANSLLLKYCLRIYDKDPSLVSPIIEELILSGASFINPGQDVVMSPRAQQWNNLGVNWSFREHNKVRLGSNLYNYLTEDDNILDSRLSIFFEPNNAEEWVAFPQLQDVNTPQSGGNPYSNQRDVAYDEKGEENIYGSVNYYLIRDELDVPEILMTAAEVKFLLAEVFLRGIGVNQDLFNAGFRYQEGMIESIQFWQEIMINSEIWEQKSEIFSAADIFNLTLHERYVFDPDGSVEENLSLIYTQRWIDAFRQPWEAFNLIRMHQGIPREKETNTFYRFQYPPSEALYNSDNYDDQVAKMGGDLSDKRLWWMKD